MTRPMPATSPLVKSPPTSQQIKAALAAVPDTPSETDDDGRDWLRILTIVGVAALVLLLAGGAYLAVRGQSAEDERASLVSLLDTECGPAGSLVGRPICVATAPQRADETAEAATAAGLDAAQVIELVRAELAANPPAGRAPSAADVDAAVRRVLAADPTLVRGQAPTDAQVQAAVAAVMAADPERFRGPAGEDGESPACLSEPGRCRGESGPAPVQITQRYADGSTSVCTRDGGSPDSAPTYTCPPPSGGGATDPEPEPTGGPDPSATPPPTTAPTTDPGFLGP